MTEMKKYANGQFCWSDLSTTDPIAAKKFYTDLFGWTAVDMPTGGPDPYTMLQRGDHHICALYKQMPGMPSAWLAYVNVDDANAATRKAKELGAKVIKEAFDVMDVGRMSVVDDPTGAVFAFWQAKKHIGATLVNEPGTLTWHELQTKNVDVAIGFYSKLFGWSTKRSKAGTHEYVELFRGNDAAGGMMEIQKEWGSVPSHWLSYFAVDDCDARAQRAKSLGASLVVPPSDIPGVGRFSVIKDPQGAVFSILKLSTK